MLVLLHRVLLQLDQVDVQLHVGSVGQSLITTDLVDELPNPHHDLAPEAPHHSEQVLVFLGVAQCQLADKVEHLEHKYGMLNPVLLQRQEQVGHSIHEARCRGRAMILHAVKIE